MKTIDPKIMSLDELKALAYDVMVELGRVQNNLRVIEQEIANKQLPIGSGEPPVDGEIVNS